MHYPIDKKLVVAVASSALFDLSESHRIYIEQGVDRYREYQEKNIDKTLCKGVAFPFIKRLLNLNEVFVEEQPVEVVLLSRNSPETGLRVFRSIQHYGLNITRAGFFSGSSPYSYLPAFNASLFLSADEADVLAACSSGYAAGRVLDSKMEDGDAGDELRIAFDFDGVIACDEAEKVYQEEGMEAFHISESTNADKPLRPGLLASLFAGIAALQQMESERITQDARYKRILKTYIVTARNAPAHERLINTLKSWGVDVDVAFFLGGIEKSRVLDFMHPHIFFDDQMGHLSSLRNIPAVHIPIGIVNTK
ncbi:MAG: 5'-nucleotidase [Prevotellaceae bacterium]|jgi:5'-nucleotidase|nr:5'-nucleotidase [Prevotellaceae bacterium]